MLLKAMRNAGSLKFSEFQTLMSQCGWMLDHQTGSHQIWYSPKNYRISVQNKKGTAKRYQVTQFLSQYQLEEQDDE